LKEYGKHKSIDAVMYIVKHLQMLGNNLMRVINKEGIDCIVDISKDFKVLSYCKLDNLKLDELNYHPIIESSHIPQKFVLDRLVRRCQKYKCMQAHTEVLREHDDASKDKDKLRPFGTLDRIEKLFQVDYS